MSESQSRYVRLRADVDRNYARNDQTYIQGLPAVVTLTDHRTLFNRHQKRMSQVCREYNVPGVAVFALHGQRGIAGHFWLAATDQLRAGTIGRHGSVDLLLTDDEGLSLRHLLVLVKIGSLGLRLHVADFATPAGFQAEEGGILRAVEANGTLVLRSASYSLFFFPTGGELPWAREAADPWATLPNRLLLAEERKTRVSAPGRLESRPAETNVTFRNGPMEPGPEPLLDPNEAVEGHLVLINGSSAQRVPVGAKALDRGVILGRYSRCAGDTTEMNHMVSRVHAVLLRFDGELHLIDAGSTNGVLKGAQEVKCAPVEPNCDYQLGGMRVRWESTE